MRCVNLEEFFDDKNLVFCYNTMGIAKHFAIIFLNCYNIFKRNEIRKREDGHG